MIIMKQVIGWFVVKYLVTIFHGYVMKTIAKGHQIVICFKEITSLNVLSVLEE